MAKTVLISGASRGIGRATAKLFASKGFNVVINYNNSEKEALILENEIRLLGVKTLAIKANVANLIEVENMFKIIKENFGGVDILVNNAGVSKFSLAQDLTETEFDKIFGVNMKSVYLLTKYALDFMISKKSGAIINISSMWGERGASCESAYSASKSAIIGYTKSLAKELGLSGIRVNAVLPGVIDTDMNACFSKEELDDLADSCSLKRIGKPEEVAELIYFLASEKSSYITGQAIAIDGGFIG
ncbi:MAG: SDR family oxidoreductase [Clostridia bacterium]|nr:SDR family oxidoreductase [Clostridia bacterium]